MRTTSIDNHTCAYASPSHPGGVQQHNQDRWLADRKGFLSFPMALAAVLLVNWRQRYSGKCVTPQPC
ncbi:hypothetical protein [Microcoleus sp. B7-D4]|uniref:hypothetical protein n=1 Tax=Microcoleus sp. B7-D4 TaxID=2818696 RepID=UPI002FD12869